jgi:competence protein ComEA
MANGNGENSIDWLNEAEVKDLENIQGIGKKRAEEIVKYRDENGEFESWDDLKKVPGFDDQMVGALKAQGEADEAKEE